MASTATTSETLPIPNMPWSVTHGYVVDPVLFADGSERRFLTSREQGLGFVYQYTDVDSATMAQIHVVWDATLGQVGCFWATDFETGSSYLVRFVDEGLKWSRSIHETLTIPLRVVGP